MGSTESIRKAVTQSLDPEVAVKQLYADLYQEDTCLVSLFCSSEYNLDKLAVEIKSTFGDIQVIGCTTAGEITPVGYMEGSITGFSLSSKDFTAVTHFFGNLQDFSIQESSLVVKDLTTELSKVSDVDINNSFGFLLVDGSSIKEESVISGVYGGIGGLGIFGASAGDGLNFGPTYVYHNGAFHSDSAVMSIINTDHPFKVFKSQHFVPTDKKFVVTGAIPERRVVTEINGDSELTAAEEYARIIDLEVDQLSPQIFASHPVMLKVGDSYYVRSIQQVNQDGSLTFYCAIDEGIVLTVAEARDILENLNTALHDLKEGVGEPKLIVGSDCILRRLELINKKQLDQASEIMSENNVIGFNTYGEQFDAMHVNHTFTGVCIF